MALSTEENEYLWRLRLQKQQAYARNLQAAEAASSLAEDSVSADKSKKTGKDDTLSVSTAENTGLSGIGISVPVLPAPTGESTPVDLSKQIALFRMDTQNAAYQSQRTRMAGEALINDICNAATQGRILSNSAAYANVVSIQTLHTLAALGAEEAIKNAQEKGLKNQLAQIEELQAQLEGLGDFTGQLESAQQKVMEQLAAVQAAQTEVKAAEAAVEQAKAALEEATPVAKAVATQAYTTAVEELSFKQKEATKADAQLATAQSDLLKAQTTAQQATELLGQIAALRQAIEQGTYEINVTEALPKITELFSSSASYIEKLADINPQIALKDTFLATLGIQPQSGVSTADLLTSELSGRLRATGMSSTEADATAALIVSGGSTEALTLPKTAVDVIQQFSNDVSQAMSNSLEALKNSFDLSVPNQNSESSSIKDNLILIQRMMDALMPDAELTEEEAITAFLVAMGESIDAMCELQDKRHEERIAIEKELQNHNQV